MVFDIISFLRLLPEVFLGGSRVFWSRICFSVFGLSLFVISSFLIGSWIEALGVFVLSLALSWFYVLPGIVIFFSSVLNCDCVEPFWGGLRNLLVLLGSQ